MYFHFGPQTLSTISIIHPSIRITTQARVFPVPFHTTRPPTTLTIPLQKLQQLVPENITKSLNQFSRYRGALMQHLSLTTPFQHLRHRLTATIATAFAYLMIGSHMVPPFLICRFPGFREIFLACKGHEQGHLRHGERYACKTILAPSPASVSPTYADTTRASIAECPRNLNVM